MQSTLASNYPLFHFKLNEDQWEKMMSQLLAVGAKPEPAQKVCFSSFESQKQSNLQYRSTITRDFQINVIETAGVLFTWLRDKNSQKPGHMVIAGQQWLETMKNQTNLLGQMTLKGEKLLIIEAVRWESFIFLHLKINQCHLVLLQESLTNPQFEQAAFQSIKPIIFRQRLTFSSVLEYLLGTKLTTELFKLYEISFVRTLQTFPEVVSKWESAEGKKNLVIQYQLILFHTLLTHLPPFQ